MFQLNDDMSIYATRGDIVFFSVSADDNGKPYKFQAGDVVRIKVYGKKDAETVVLQKDFPVTEVTETVEVFLTMKDTKIGDVISKPKDYWYEIVLNDDTNPQTIIGYDEDGAKLFRLFPEGEDIDVPETDPEDIPVVDRELDLTSPRPVENRVITKKILEIENQISNTDRIPTRFFGTKDFAEILLNVKSVVVKLDNGCLTVPGDGNHYYEDITGGLMLGVGNGASSVRFDFYGGGATGKYITYKDGDSTGLYIETNVSSVSGLFHATYVKVENEGDAMSEVKHFALTPLNGAAIS